ncbi:PKD domain-containing protein [Spartinivicinus ruber]|uniref:PKD domain-containing protein n=1 Tax=Spartinivicinus ruber TaxID=2683272 RepID=UPI0013D16819|nr:PKD domain-containing protein [Spartinivicinus ruber]
MKIANQKNPAWVVSLGVIGVLGVAPLLHAQASQEVIDSNNLFNPSPIIIADKVEKPLDVMLSRTVLGDAKLIITEPNASFIKVHFKHFNIPDGSYVTISNPSGTEVYHYSNTHRDSFTFDADAGEDGKNSWASMSVNGDTAIVEFHNNRQVEWDTQTNQLIIGSYLKGFPEAVIESLIDSSFSTCGTNQRKDAICYKDSFPVEFERTRPVARLVMGGSLCTAWRVGANNHVFTNNHCMSTQSKVAASEVWFNYQRTACGGGNMATTTKVSGKDMLKTDYTLDYTLFSIDNFSAVKSFGYYGLDISEPTNQERIYIAQHGSGNPKELAVESDKNTGNRCRVDVPSANGRGTGTDLGYLCDTIGGSSGSPVLAADTNKAIGLHHYGGCPNQGVKISKIWPQVSGYFGGKVPDGDNGGTTKKAPVAGFNYQVTDLTVKFVSTSKDPDGNITRYQWNFGDGNTSAAANPTHKYVKAGSYTATLAVTDNDGLTDQTQKQVKVSDNSGVGVLVKGKPVTNVGANKGEWKYYKITVPAGAKNLVIQTSGGTGDGDLYVNVGSKPSLSKYTCRPYYYGNNETCKVSAVTQQTEYFVGLHAYANFNGVTLAADYQESNLGEVTNFRLDRKNIFTESGIGERK